MEAFLSSVKRKIRYSDSSGSSQEISPAEKRLKEFSFDHADEDEVMAAELAGNIDLRRNPPGLRVVVGQNYVPKLFTPYCKLLCYCFKYLIKRNLF